MRQPSRGPEAREVWHFDLSARPARAELEHYYWVNDGQLSSAFGSNLPPRLADLVDLTMAIYYADRRAVRVRNPYALTGQRDFNLRLPVRDPELWSRDEVVEKLTDVLSWYTEDRWSFTFGPRQAPPRPSEAEPYLFPAPVQQPAVTVLFSGGLDSLAGLVAQLERYPDHSFVLLSGCTHDRLAAIQHDLVTHLRRAWHNSSRELISIRVPFGIRKLKGRLRKRRAREVAGLCFWCSGPSQPSWRGANAYGSMKMGQGPSTCGTMRDNSESTTHAGYTRYHSCAWLNFLA